MIQSDVDDLRAVGWADQDTVDIVHQTAMFNYMTRVADSLGVELDTAMLEAEARTAGRRHQRLEKPQEPTAAVEPFSQTDRRSER